jgi:hypothetical protein
MEYKKYINPNQHHSNYNPYNLLIKEKCTLRLYDFFNCYAHNFSGASERHSMIIEVDTDEEVKLYIKNKFNSSKFFVNIKCSDNSNVSLSAMGNIRIFSLNKSIKNLKLLDNKVHFYQNLYSGYGVYVHDKEEIQPIPFFVHRRLNDNGEMIVNLVKQNIENAVKM